jgi:hypothetical protein
VKLAMICQHVVFTGVSMQEREDAMGGKNPGRTSFGLALRPEERGGDSLDHDGGVVGVWWLKTLVVSRPKYPASMK